MLLIAVNSEMGISLVYQNYKGKERVHRQRISTPHPENSLVGDGMFLEIYGSCGLTIMGSSSCQCASQAAVDSWDVPKEQKISKCRFECKVWA